MGTKRFSRCTMALAALLLLSALPAAAKSPASQPAEKAPALEASADELHALQTQVGKLADSNARLAERVEALERENKATAKKLDRWLPDGAPRPNPKFP